MVMSLYLRAQYKLSQLLRPCSLRRQKLWEAFIELLLKNFPPTETETKAGLFGHADFLCQRRGLCLDLLLTRTEKDNRMPMFVWEKRLC
jgi:hypothetical protein